MESKLYAVSDAMDKYASQHTSTLDKWQLEILEYTIQNHSQWHMLSGATQGQFLRNLCILSGAMHIIEIGCFTGFSAACMASSLPIGGTITTLEKNEKDAETAQNFFNKMPYGDKISLQIGDAKELLEKQQGIWDFAYIDADKKGYIQYYEMLVPKMKKGGLIVADNVLFKGEVYDPANTNAISLALDAYNKYVCNDIRTENILLTIRDGLMLARIL